MARIHREQPDKCQTLLGELMDLQIQLSGAFLGNFMISLWMMLRYFHLWLCIFITTIIFFFSVVIHSLMPLAKHSPKKNDVCCHVHSNLFICASRPNTSKKSLKHILCTATKEGISWYEIAFDLRLSKLYAFVNSGMYSIIRITLNAAFFINCLASVN